MISVKIYKQNEAEKLYQQQTSPLRKKMYYENNFDFLDSCKPVQVLIDMTSGIPKLNVGKDDFFNAKTLYSNFGALPIDVAIDPRLWIYLAHNNYRDYSISRWKNNDGTFSIDEHFFGFFKYSTDRALSRNSIARLYWGARLTVNDYSDEIKYYFASGDDPYVYTEMLFSDSNVFSQLTTRSLSRNKKLVLSILHFMKEKKIELTKKNIISFCKIVCLQMHNLQLSFLNPEEIFNLYDQIIDL